jgi:hypothetical protein
VVASCDCCRARLCRVEAPNGKAFVEGGAFGKGHDAVSDLARARSTSVGSGSGTGGLGAGNGSLVLTPSGPDEVQSSLRVHAAPNAASTVKASGDAPAAYVVPSEHSTVAPRTGSVCGTRSVGGTACGMAWRGFGG